MFSYSAFGLNLQSALSLPELVPHEGRAEVSIRTEPLPEVAAELRCSQRYWRVAPEETCFFWDEIGAFAVRGGREILVDPRPGVDPRWVRLGILGPGMAALLQQRGILILHASTVAVRGAAVAFMGASGWGKSTLAAALHARGHPLVGDDVLAVCFDADAPRVIPGFPQFKLWPDALALFNGASGDLPRVNPEIDKRARPVRDGFVSGGSLPLSHIYLLARGDTPKVEPIRPKDAFLELVSHSYGINWLHDVSGAGHFAQRAALAQTVPIYRLERPWTLRMLSTVVDLIEQDGACSG